MAIDLRSRSIRTLAWLGDVEFEREVRSRLVARGDYPADRLDAMKARIVCAEAQAELLAMIEPALRDDEAAIVRRARNASVRSTSRAQRSTRDYRAATAFEALVAHWIHSVPEGRQRLQELVDPPLEGIIDRAIAGAGLRLRRG